MFYAHIVLAKKGPLARIWLAAHWDKKLTKAHVFETNIEQSIEGIMQPKVKLALRTSGHLLLGVVRIYSRKAKYLLADCNEAFVKIKMAFRPGVVDLPEEHREAAVNAITLPEVFHDFDTALPELNDVDIEAQFSINQSRADEITMREDYGTLPMNIHDDGFGDIGFEPNAPDIVRNNLDESMADDFFSDTLENNIRMRSSKETTAGSSKLLDGIQENLSNDFGDSFEQPAAGLFEGDIFGEGPLQTHSLVSVANKQDDSEDDDDDDDGHFDGGAPSPIPSSENSRACTPGPAIALNSPLLTDKKITEENSLEDPHKNETLASKIDDGNVDTSNLQATEEESFALAPIDSTVVKGLNNKSKRKRKLIVDEIKNISGDEMKNQLANTTDIVTTLDLAPPTKRLMYWKETGGVEKLFALPSRDYCANPLFLNYQRQLITKLIGIEEFSKLGPSEIIITERNAFDGIQSPSAKKKRKQKNNEQINRINEPEILRENEFSMLTNITIEEKSNTNKNLQNDYEDNILNMSGDNQLVSDSSDHVLEGHFTPSGLDHGGITPNHCIENIDTIPNLHVDQVSSILNASSVEQYANMEFENEISSEKISHDWDGDYDYPQSSEQILDEQGVDETMEQFEERVLNKRAAHLFISVRSTLQKRGNISLSDLTVNNNRKQAAQKFYSILVLKKFQVLNLQQAEPYNAVVISKGPCFDNPKL